MAIIRVSGGGLPPRNLRPLPAFMGGLEGGGPAVGPGEIAAAAPAPGPSDWGAATYYRTASGAVVSDRVVRFQSQADQIRYLRDVIDEYRAHPTIRELARDIVFRQSGGVTPRNEVEYAIALGSWVQQHVRYVRELPEIFQTPTETLRGFGGQAAGDCDDHATLVGALLESLGIKAEIVGMEWDTPGGRYFQHIWTRAKITASNGRTVRVPLDTTLSTAPVSDLVDPAALARSRGMKVRLFVL